MAEIQTINRDPPPSAPSDPAPPTTLNASPALQPSQPPASASVPIAPDQLPSAQTPTRLPPPQTPPFPTATPSTLPPPSPAMPTSTRAQLLAQHPVPIQPSPQVQTPTTTQQSGRLPPGAPGRNYLNQHLAPYLRTGMTSVLDVRPANPLRWLGEYLIAQSFVYEGGTDDKGITEAFTYEEHVAQIKKMRPEALGADRDMADSGHEEGEEGVKAETGGPKTGEDTVMAD